MSDEIKIEKSIENQILDKTIEKLMESELFPEKLVKQLREIDLTNKASVKAAISVLEEEEG